MESRDLPLSMVTLVFGALSIPLAFARQLCVPALIMAILAIGFHHWGRRRRAPMGFTPASIRRSTWGYRAALPGAASALGMWLLWASGLL